MSNEGTTMTDRQHMIAAIASWLIMLPTDAVSDVASFTGALLVRHLENPEAELNEPARQLKAVRDSATTVRGPETTQ